MNFRQAQTPVVATGGASVLASRFRFNFRTKAGSSVALYLFFALQPKTLQGAAGRLACLPAAAGEDKTVAIVAYLTLIGFIAATIIHSNKKTKLGAFHLRQMLGFMLTWFAVIILIIIPIVGWILIPAFYIFMFVCWITGLLAAINGQMMPMPLVGSYYQKWFGTTFD